MTYTREALAIGQALRELRLKRGWLTCEVAYRLGMKPQSVSRIEHGRWEPKLRTLRAFADMYGVRLSDVVRVADSVEAA